MDVSCYPEIKSDHHRTASKNRRGSNLGRNEKVQTVAA